MIKCPFCAEEIQDEAIKCKHCGEFLSKDRSIQDSFEYNIMKIYKGLDYYIKYLPYFGWEIISNQKVNYGSYTETKTNSRKGIFDKNYASGTSGGNTTYYFYNELSLKRNKSNAIPKEILNIENDFFEHINNIYRVEDFGYIFKVIIYIILGFIFSSISNSGAILFFVLISSIIYIVFYGEKNNRIIRKRKKNEKSKNEKYYQEIFAKYGLK